MVPGVAAILFLAVHAVLGVLVVKVSLITAIHGFLTAGVGFWWAVSPRRGLHEVAMVAAYITGAEVLWRMSNDALFYEIAKYSVTGMFVVALVRKHGVGSLTVPLLCFALLLPSVMVAAPYQPWSVTRNQLSFNLSGPLALAVCAAYFATLQLSSAHLQRLFIAGIAPAVGIGANVIYGIVTNPDIVFFGGSNKYLAGLWSANQVASAFSLAAVFALLFLIDKAIRWELRITMLVLMVWLFFQGILTFSRGGPLCAVASALGLMVCLTRDKRALTKMLGAVAVLGALGYFVIWPQLDEFTGGGLSKRFQDMNTTGRTDLSAADLELFFEHPLLGVGPGRAAQEHTLGLPAHTEFTRLLAEHGLFGVAWMAIMFVTMAWSVKRSTSPYQRGIVVAMMVWSLLFMANSAMRLVAPCLAFGLGFARFASANSLAEPLPSPAVERSRSRRTLAWARP
jgi:hypothetical protein